MKIEIDGVAYEVDSSDVTLPENSQLIDDGDLDESEYVPLDRLEQKLDAHRLKAIRQALRFTQEEMAERLGYSSYVSISRIEREVEKMSPQVKAHLDTIQKHELKNNIMGIEVDESGRIFGNMTKDEKELHDKAIEFWSKHIDSLNDPTIPIEERIEEHVNICNKLINESKT